MKPFFLGLVLCTSLLVNGQNGSHYCAEHKSNNRLHAQHRSNTLNLSQIELTEEYDVHFYKLDLEVERTTVDLQGEVEIHAKILAPNLSTFLFELHEDLAISSVFVNGVSSIATRVGSAVTVPVSLVQNDQIIVKVNYGGTPPNQATNPLAGGGINNGVSNTWGNQVTWTLSEPFSAYEWWPCKQSLTDKADSVYIYLTTDSTNKAGSNGLLQQVVDLGNGKHRYEWQSFYPIDYYLVSFTVAKYVDYSFYANPVGALTPVLVQNYIYDNPATLANFQNEIDNTADFLEYFSTIFGLYPFHEEKYGHCMAPFGGGMEHQTMTSQGWFEDGLTAHELGHQWFGDNVTCATWADIWLNEGFASYAEYLMEANFNAGNEGPFMEDVHDIVMDQPDGAIWVEDSLNTGRIFDYRLTYNKGSAIIHTLRFLINDDATFFNILKIYQSQYGGSSAYLDDFKLIAENNSGLDLTPFFNEWYYGEGFPTYSVKYASAGNETLLQIIQSTSSNMTPFYTNDLEIKLVGIDGSTGVYRIPISDSVTNYFLPFSATIVGLEIDPNNWVVNKDGQIIEEASLLKMNETTELTSLIYPNPAKSSLWVDLKEKAIIIVYNLEGQVVLHHEFNKGKQKIDLSNLASGQYMVLVNGISQSLIID